MAEHIDWPRIRSRERSYRYDGFRRFVGSGLRHKYLQFDFQSGVCSGGIYLKTLYVRGDGDAYTRIDDTDVLSEWGAWFTGAKR